MAELRRIGKYEILEEIGRGSLAVVYKARDTEIDRIVALKVVHRPSVDEAAFVGRFQREARTAASLHHPNIVTVYDSGDVGGTLYLTMAFIGGECTLSDLLAKEGPLPLERALPILTQLANALDYLHGHEPPLIHREVKPANVLLEQEGDDLHVVLTDFGMAGLVEISTEVSGSDFILGDPAYIAPEQADSKRWGAVTPLTDVYALGVVAYELLTGRTPFEGTMATVLYAHTHEPPPSPLELAPNLGTDVAEVLTQALAKPPAERYPSAGALVTALRQSAEPRVRRERQLAQWYDEAVAYAEDRRWAEACRTWIDVLRRRLDYRDGAATNRLLDAVEGLLSQHDEQARRSREALTLFDALAASVEGEDWERTIEVGERLIQLAPDLGRPQIWMARARGELRARAEPSAPPTPDPRRFGTGDLPPRAVLANRYVILKRTARGGTGATYQAQDQQRQDKTVTVKEISVATVPPSEQKLALESFQRMAKVLSQLRHPNLAQVIDHFQAWGRHYVVTEFIRGQTFAQMLEGRREPFSEKQVLTWAAQLCDVLSYLHSQEPKIIFRGLKPDNVVLASGTDTVKLVGFSVARFFKPGLDKDTFALGAVGYAAPEQYGTAQTDERTDIYALGVTLHQLLTLHDPTTKMFVFPPVRQLNRRVSRRVAQAIAKAISRSPGERFQTALEMKNALLRRGML